MQFTLSQILMCISVLQLVRNNDIAVLAGISVFAGMVAFAGIAVFAVVTVFTGIYNSLTYDV